MRTTLPTQKIISLLKKRKWTITFAESCTGGKIAAEFVAVSGASHVFNGSVVSYSNSIKQQWLGVRAETLQQFGAVSPECVKEMLKGVLKLAKADCAIAVSGIAGPEGGTPAKPVGTVYIGLQTPDSHTIYRKSFQGDRETVQRLSVEFAIQKIYEMIK